MLGGETGNGRMQLVSVCFLRPLLILRSDFVLIWEVLCEEKVANGTSMSRVRYVFSRGHSEAPGAIFLRS